MRVVEKTRHVVGLDLGQTNDPTAFVDLEFTEKSVWKSTDVDPTSDNHLEKLVSKTMVRCRQIRRWLEVPYTAIVKEVIGAFLHPVLLGQTLVPDWTGVGRPVMDMFLAPVACDHRDVARWGKMWDLTVKMQAKWMAMIHPWKKGDDLWMIPLQARAVPVTITGGKGRAVRDGIGWRVPKKELCGSVQSLLSSRRLLVSKELPDAAVLVKELENFKVKINVDTNNESFGCFVAGTMVATIQGEKPIELVRCGDMVLTRMGWKRVLWSGESRKLSELTITKFSSNSSLSSSHNHLIWTESGWKEMGNLTQGEICQKNYFNSGEEFTPGKIGMGTTRVEQDISIGMCGSITMVPFLVGIISTTLTKILTIIEQKILRALPVRNMRNGMMFCENGTGLRKQGNIFELLETKTDRGRNTFVINAGGCFYPAAPLKRMGSFDFVLPYAMTDGGKNSAPSFMTDVVGIVSEHLKRRIQEAVIAPFPVLTRIGISSNTCALNAENRSPVKGGAGETRFDFVPQFAGSPTDTRIGNIRQSIAGNAEKVFRQSIEPRNTVRVVASPHIVKMTEPVPVYDLVVDDCHEFYANGILVHNSWREKEHDDTVLALAVASFVGEQPRKVAWIR